MGRAMLRKRQSISAIPDTARIMVEGSGTTGPLGCFFRQCPSTMLSLAGQRPEGRGTLTGTYGNMNAEAKSFGVAGSATGSSAAASIGRTGNDAGPSAVTG